MNQPLNVLEYLRPAGFNPQQTHGDHNGQNKKGFIFFSVIIIEDECLELIINTISAS